MDYGYPDVIIRCAHMYVDVLMGTPDGFSLQFCAVDSI
jgi:hypothetical protein